MHDKAQFHWDNPQLINQPRTEDERTVRNAAQAYCRGTQQPHVFAALYREVVDTYNGTHDIHALMLGREQTGIAAP